MKPRVLLRALGFGQGRASTVCGVGLLVASLGVGSGLFGASGCAAGDVTADEPVLFDAGPPEPDAENGFADASSASDFTPTTGECAEETKQIYVLGADKALYRFNPEQLQFTRVGFLGCASSTGTFSMAVDRHGTAWVEYQDGHVFAVDTTDGTCKPTPFRAGQTGFETFGMGFALDEEGKTNETLFVAGAALASLDPTSFDLTIRGSLSFGRTELTSIGAELYAFSPRSGVVAGLDKATGATKVTYRTSAVGNNVAFAFTQWGGDFWIFTGESTSSVTRYSPSTDTSTTPIENTGILIVGAGTSTCAPTKPPS